MGGSWPRRVSSELAWYHRCHLGGLHHRFLHSFCSSSLAPCASDAAAEQPEPSAAGVRFLYPQHRHLVLFLKSCTPSRRCSGWQQVPHGPGTIAGTTRGFPEDAWNSTSTWGQLGRVPDNFLTRAVSFCQGGYGL